MTLSRCRFCGPHASAPQVASCSPRKLLRGSTVYGLGFRDLGLTVRILQALPALSDPELPPAVGLVLKLASEAPASRAAAVHMVRGILSF